MQERSQLESQAESPDSHTQPTRLTNELQQDHFEGESPVLASERSDESLPCDLEMFGAGKDPKRVRFDDVELTLAEKSSNLSSENLKSIRSYIQLPNITRTLRTVPRAEFLPGLFRFQGKPYSLKGREPFHVMLSHEQPKKLIVVSGRQCGKSNTLAYSEVFDTISIPNFKILYVAPQEVQAQRFGNGYLSEALASCYLAKQLQSKDLEGVFTDTKILTGVMHQAFANGSSIQLTYAKTSADRARGITADRIDFDEIQDQLIDNIPIITASLTTSEYQFERYTGTAKTIDNTIESLWQDSSMCEWVLPCEGCGHWNIPNDENQVYEGTMIQADGLHCTKCGKKLDVYHGEWMATYEDRMRDFQGYHTPQIIFPAIVNNPNLWSRVVQNKIRQTESAFKQETLGISCSTGSRIITQRDIDEHSLLPSMLELQSKLSRYPKLVGGLDWGGAERESFTVHTIIGIRADGRMDVVYAKRYQGFSPDEVLPSIAKAHRFYNCEALAADYGMGFDKNIMLQKLFGIRMCQMMFCHQLKLLSYSPSLGYPRWTVDKTTALDTLFMAIKNHRMYFPAEGFDKFTKDLLSPFEEVSDVGELQRRRYLRNPNQPDDFCMALCFGAMLAMKLIYGSDNIDMIPDTAFNRGITDDETPPDLHVLDPADVLTSL